MRKFLVSTLVAAMCLAFSATAFAAAGTIQPAAFSDIAGHQAEADLTLLGAMGVFSGESGLGGPVGPDDPLTRVQFCKVVVEAFGRGTMAAALGGLRPDFVDEIPAWAWGYVNVATYMGVINGYEDGSFRAGNYVTYGEAVTMLIRAVGGHKDQVGAGVWPYNYIFYGVDNSFNGPVDVSFSGLPCTRGDMAQMLVATMQINAVDAEGKELADPATAALAGRIVSGLVTTFDADSLTIGGAEILLADKLWLLGADSYEGLRNLSVWGVLDAKASADGKLFFAKVAESTDVVSGIFKDLGDADDDGYLDHFVLADGTKVPYAEDTVAFDGVADNTWGQMVTATINLESGRWTEEDLWNTGYGAECVFTLDENGKAVNVVAVYFDSSENARHVASYNLVDYITPSENYDASNPDTWTRLEAIYRSGPIPATCSVIINGEPATPDDLEHGDVIDVALDWNTDYPYIIRVHRELVEGNLTAKSASYPGPIQAATLTLADGSTRTFTINQDGTINYALLNLDAQPLVQWALDFEGNAFASLAYEELTPYAVILSYTQYGTGDDAHYEATFDVRGETVTYRVDGTELDEYCLETPVPLDDLVDEQAYVYLCVNSGTGTVDTAYSYAFVSCASCCDYQVLAVDTVNGTLTLAEYGDLDYIVFVDDPTLVVYERADDGTKTYVGLEGLQPGDWVTGDLCCGLLILTVIDEPAS